VYRIRWLAQNLNLPLVKRWSIGENLSKNTKLALAPEKPDVALLVAFILMSAVIFPSVSAKGGQDFDLRVSLPGKIEPQYLARWAEEYLWTLEFQVHAPKYGYTDGSTSWSYESNYVVGPYQSSSTLSFGYSLTTSDGQTIGRFERCLWRYEYWENIIGTSREYWYVKQRTEQYINNYIYGSSTSTDSDDIESFTYNGYRSHTYRARYVTQDRREDNNIGQWLPITVSAAAGDLIQAALTITVTVKTFSASGTFSLKNARSTTWQYTYRLAPYHSWSIDYLDSKNIVWAFRLNW